MPAERRILSRRVVPEHSLPDELPPLLKRLYAARGLVAAPELSLRLANLLAPDALLGVERSAQLLADAVVDQQRIVIVGDYDCDGATGTAVAMLGLSLFGARHVDYLVPNRFTMGYGLSPLLADAARAMGAELLITVDNGIASISGVARAKMLGMTVIVTDHHLAGDLLPAADAIVDPNQPGCGFAHKSLAGVGVMFYVLSRLRAELRRRGHFGTAEPPTLGALLDLVAIGTVADVARLDYNNRILVAEGVRRIRAGRARPGVAALLQVAAREPAQITAIDLGFVLGPRINAAGRMDDIRVGIECLLAPTLEAALPLAQALDSINRSRRARQTEMTDEASAQLADGDPRIGLCMFDDRWHEGVVGLVASRIKERRHRPAIAFARAQEAGLLKGSARSIEGLNVRDALAAIDARHPGLIERFGGHAMAAGLSLREAQFPAFAQAFDEQCRGLLSEAQLQRRIETDGELEPAEFAVATAQLLETAGPWGQGFPEPCFDQAFEVLESRCVGGEGQHVKYRLRLPGVGLLNAIHFGGAEARVERGALHAAFSLGINRWQGQESLDLRIEYLEPA
jgi:single-stranded-DNA-specific exonuclease